MLVISSELIEEITDKTDATGSRITRQVRAMKTVTQKEGNVCGKCGEITYIN